MQKTLIKSLLAVAVAGTFATFVNSANLPKQVTEYVEDDGTVVPDAIDENFQFLNGRANALDTRLTTAEGRIDLNSHAIADNYKEMKNNFAAVNSRIDKLDDKMKKGFASQAALNGLFQPYNVGKFNVSAAIGGYDSEQAMALGAGYRFNKNFAIKAGIASDLSGFDHVTYNVGANFEF